jgi:hypothetical protein
MLTSKTTLTIPNTAETGGCKTLVKIEIAQKELSYNKTLSGTVDNGQPGGKTTENNRRVEYVGYVSAVRTIMVAKAVSNSTEQQLGCVD